MSDYRRHQQEQYRRSNSHQPTELYKPTPYRPDPVDLYRQEPMARPVRTGGSRPLPEGLSRHRSLSLNRENSWKKNQRATPDRSLLSRYINQDLQEMSPPPPPPPPLTSEERRRGRRTSRFLRPDFYDTPKEESAYVKQKEEEARLRQEQTRRAAADRRQQMQSEEEARGRINRTINSLQHRAGSQDITESNLIKRAVSSDDCAQFTDQPRTPGKVNSVLGMFKRMEKPAEKSSISRFRRAQSVYENSSSDSVPTDYQEFPRFRRPDPPTARTPSAFMPYRNTNSEEKSVGEEDLSEDFSRHNSSRDGHDDSFDSWSVCSDSQEPPEDETVSDRIRRKSFYTRFNDYVTAPKQAQAKPSPEVIAILERGIQKQQKQQRHREQQEHQRRQQNAAASRMNMYGSLPRGWEPQAEQDYYQQARKLSRYGHHSHVSGPIFPTQPPPPMRRPTRPHESPSPMVDH